MKLLTQDQVKLGFVGVGNMGSRIVQRLLNAGYRVAVYDRNHFRAEVLIAHGAVFEANIAELAWNSDVILSCLTNDEPVQSVYGGEAGVLASARPGTVVLEMSTVSPLTSRELYKQGAERQIEVLDLAISGSTSAAEQGSLVLLAGGDKDAFQAAQPIIRPISARSFLMGPAGAGTTMKLVVNTLLGVGMQAIAEAIPLGEMSGIDRNRLLDVLSQTAVVAAAHAGKLRRVAREDYSPQFPIRLMHKDFRLILEKAKSLNIPMPATAAAFSVNSMERADNPEADFSAVVRRMEKLAQVKVNGNDSGHDVADTEALSPFSEMVGISNEKVRSQ
jgi:3-hydroxyisobutyrate dehydrogenase-like beta-hydroxyacid dehydrogenase